MSITKEYCKGIRVYGSGVFRVVNGSVYCIKTVWRYCLVMVVSIIASLWRICFWGDPYDNRKISWMDIKMKLFNLFRKKPQAKPQAVKRTLESFLPVLEMMMNSLSEGELYVIYHMIYNKVDNLRDQRRTNVEFDKKNAKEILKKYFEDK